MNSPFMDNLKFNNLNQQIKVINEQIALLSAGSGGTISEDLDLNNHSIININSLSTSNSNILLQDDLNMNNHNILNVENLELVDLIDNTQK